MRSLSGGGGKVFSSSQTHNMITLATSALSHPPPFFQHFNLNELSSTVKMSFTIESVVTLAGGGTFRPGATNNTQIDTLTTLGKGTFWRASRALVTGTTLRLLEQTIIVAVGSQLFSDVFLEDAAEVSRETNKVKSNRSELVARGEASMSALSSGVRTTVLYHLSVALVGVGEYYLNSWCRWNKKKKQAEDTWVVDTNETKEWNKYVWTTFGWSTLTTGVGAGIGTFLSPGVGSAVGKLIGMNIVYFTATEPINWNEKKL